MTTVSPALPPELMLGVLRHLDPIADRRTLLALLRVSSNVWELAAPVLYGTMRLTVRQLRLLLGASLALDATQRADFLDDEGYKELRSAADYEARFGPVALSARTRRSLQLVRALTLLAPLHTQDVFLLWLAPVPAEPLFGGVRNFAFMNDPAHWGVRVPFDPPARPDPRLLLFDAPDACLRAWEQFALLPARRWRSVTLHGVLPLFDDRHVPAPWLAFRIFSPLWEQVGHQHRTRPLIAALDARDPGRALPAIAIHLESDGDESMSEAESETDNGDTEGESDSESSDETDSEPAEAEAPTEPGSPAAYRWRRGRYRRAPTTPRNPYPTLDDLRAGKNVHGPRFRVVVTGAEDRPPAPCIICREEDASCLC